MTRGGDELVEAVQGLLQDVVGALGAAVRGVERAVQRRTADLAKKNRELAETLDKLTRAPATMVEADVAALREAGFDDPAILDINQIAGFFAWCNRTVDGLGVELESYWPEKGGSGP